MPLQTVPEYFAVQLDPVRSGGRAGGRVARSSFRGTAGYEVKLDRNDSIEPFLCVMRVIRFQHILEGGSADLKLATLRVERACELWVRDGVRSDCQHV